MKNNPNIIAQEIEFFHQNGYLVKKDFVDLNILNQIQSKVAEHLQARIKPFELEQEVDYPGSPKALSDQGGDTIRRLLMAYGRDSVFKNWSNNTQVVSIIRKFLDCHFLFLVQSHHNCVMTKQPQFSSETHWHKDTRYWNFANNQLINTWLPLGAETEENGCLHVIPTSHLWNATKEQLDKRLFLRKDLLDNQKWLNKAVAVELKKGDLLFFHAALFHAAGRNTTDESKNAVVFTYHSENNYEINNPYPDFTAVEI